MATIQLDRASIEINRNDGLVEFTSRITGESGSTLVFLHLAPAEARAISTHLLREACHIERSPHHLNTLKKSTPTAE